MSVAGLGIDEQAEHGGFDRIVAVNAGVLGDIDKGQVFVAILFGLTQVLDKLTQDIDGGFNTISRSGTGQALMASSPFRRQCMNGKRARQSVWEAGAGCWRSVD
jgi:hypothetical protein